MQSTSATDRDQIESYISSSIKNAFTRVSIAIYLKNFCSFFPISFKFQLAVFLVSKMYNARTPLLPNEQGWGKKFVMNGIVAAFKIKKT